MELVRGKQSKAIKCLLYGPEGIGKSTFASQFPNPVFIDTENGTDHMDVTRTPKPTSWTMLKEQVKYFIQHPNELGTLVIDTADWAEKMCIEQICAEKQVKGIEDFGYGRGYIYLAEEFGRLLNLLEDLKDKGVHILMTAHATMRKFEQPDEMGAYDRWELKLGKKTAPLCKEWVDMVLLANYKTYVVNVDNLGAVKGKNKAQGGSRVMYTTHHPCWDAKNRHGLPDELPLDYGRIAHIFGGPVPASPPAVYQAPASPLASSPPQPPASPATAAPAPTQPPESTPAAASAPPTEIDPSIPPALRDLMAQHQVRPEEIQLAVAKKGYYTYDTPISNYDPSFVSGVLVGAWPQVFGMIQETRDNVPF